MLYELVCDGEHPYADSRPVVDEPVIDPLAIRPDLDPRLAAFLRRACASKRVTRFDSAGEMEAELRGIRDDL
jgi:hypothetical protein